MKQILAFIGLMGACLVAFSTAAWIAEKMIDYIYRRK